MSVFHCPLCPLIFEYRSEVEHHLRNEHRSRADEEAALASELAAVSRELTWERFGELEASRAGTAVTILMATAPAPAMTSLDVARLRRLAYQARRRVAQEPGAVPGAVEYRLARTVAAAEGVVTHAGLAILVNAEHLAIFRLPFEPADRVVVDPTFATRDLEVALRCYPPYRLVVLGHQARLFEGRGLYLSEIDPTPTGPRVIPPHPRAVAPHARDGRRSARPERWSLGWAHRQAGVHVVDEMVSARVATHGELPLMVAGDGRWRAQFRRHSRHAASLVGELAAIRGRDAAPRLAELAQPHLAQLTQQVEDQAVAELRRSESSRLIAWGLAAAWAAVYDGTADRLWIERGYACPGRVVAGRPAPSMAANPDEPGVNDDLVDDLIQLAHVRGVTVDLMADGSLHQPEPIAARLRTGARVLSEVAGTAAM